MSFVDRHQLITDKWAGLSTEEKNEWEKKAQEQKPAPEDEALELLEKAVNISITNFNHTGNRTILKT